MTVRWKKALPKFVVWLTAEVLLNLMGLDNLADFGEFVFERNIVVKVRAIAPEMFVT